MYFLNIITAAFIALAGYIILPFILLMTPFKDNQLRWLDSLMGNKVDGTGADFQMKGSQVTMPDTWYNRMFPRYMWLAIRNPTNNFLRNAGVNGIVKEVSKGAYLTTATIGTKKAWMILIYKEYGNRYVNIKIGTKLMDDDRTKSKLIVGHHFENSLAFQIQPWRKL